MSSLAIGAAAVVGAGGVIYSLGYGLENAGFENTGKLVSNFGKYTAYTVLVPADILLYEGPKKAITEWIPKIGRLFIEKVWIPALEKLSRLTEKVLERIKYVVDYYLQPILNKVVDIVHKYFCIPLAKVANWVGERLVVVWDFARDKILIPCWQGVKKVMTWIEINFLPLLEKVVVWLQDKVVKVLTFIGEKVLIPLAEMANKVMNWVVNNIIDPLSEAAKWLGEKFLKVVHFIEEHVLFPLMEKAQIVLAWCIEKVVMPIWREVAKGAQWVFAEIIGPAFELAGRAVVAVGSAAHALAEELAAIITKIYVAVTEDIIALFQRAK